MRISLALHVRTPRTVKGTPSELWKSRCHAGRVAVNSGHEDFPTLLAEALDVIAALDDDVKAAAEKLGCSPTQLVKLLQQERHALPLVNRARAERGLHPMK